MFLLPGLGRVFFYVNVKGEGRRKSYVTESINIKRFNEMFRVIVLTKKIFFKSRNPFIEGPRDLEIFVKFHSLCIRRDFDVFSSPNDCDIMGKGTHILGDFQIIWEGGR